MTAPCSPDSTSAAAPTSGALARPAPAAPELTTTRCADRCGPSSPTSAPRGDAGVRELTARVRRLRRRRPPRPRRRAALPRSRRCRRSSATALDVAADRIRAYHELQADAPEPALERDGVSLRELAVPVDRAGLYVPGGRAAYPSTVLMTAIPAQLAGVDELVLCVPPAADGSRPAVDARRGRAGRGRRGVPRRWRAGDRRAGVRHRDASARST